MPDGYGYTGPHNYTDHQARERVRDVMWILADHLRYDHGKSMIEISKNLELPFKEIRERYQAKT